MFPYIAIGSIIATGFVLWCIERWTSERNTSTPPAKTFSELREALPGARPIREIRQEASEIILKREMLKNHVEDCVKAGLCPVCGFRLTITKKGVCFTYYDIRCQACDFINGVTKHT